MESLVKLDSKGRILIPISFRKKMGIRPDSELILFHGKERNGIKVMPICDKSATKCTVTLSDSPGGLSGVMGVLEMLNVGVLMSESRNFMGNGASEWTFVLDTSQASDETKMLKDRLTGLEGVKSVNLMDKKE
jgi:bifunctional DNA-binding transcriptional regulator/antitoxin component of YhaV-PrlF toxin-antitoxin module